MSRRKTRRDLRHLLIVPTVLVLCLVLLPVIVVIAIAFGNSSTYQFPPHGLTLRWFQTFLVSPIFSDALFRISLPLAFAASFCATLIGTLADIAGRVRLVDVATPALVVIGEVVTVRDRIRGPHAATERDLSAGDVEESVAT